MSQYLFGYVEKVCADAVEHYQVERERWVRGPDAVRSDLVRAIVDGGSFESTSASAALGYELDRPHVALLVWADPRRDEQPPVVALRAAALQVARHLGGSDMLAVPIGQATVWAWTTGDQLNDGSGRRLAIDQGLLGAVGGLGYGAEGFVSSHREACAARRMAGLLSRPTGSVVRYRSVVLNSLLSSDPDAATRFVESELGPLCSESDANRRLRATLTVFFEEGMNWSRTARRLGVHQNTVMYRVRRAEELLGRPFSDRRLELEAALRLTDAYLGLKSSDLVRSAG
jgi:DNA-binding PucR family transcriptional regulator